MKNNSNEIYRTIDITCVQKAANDIPVEMIDKFPEFKAIIEIINQMTNEGYGISEIERKVMGSEEYQRLEKMQDGINKLQNELEGIDPEKDYKTTEWSQKYTEKIQNAANKVYNDIRLDTKNEYIKEIIEVSENNSVYWFEEIGYVITEKQLAVELAKIGKLICLKSAFHMLDLLALLTGVPLSPRADDNNILNRIIEKEGILIDYIVEFEKTYRVR